MIFFHNRHSKASIIINARLDSRLSSEPTIEKGINDWRHKSFVMAAKKNSAHVATNATSEVTTTLLCMDAKVTTNDKVIEQGQTIDARVTYVDDDHLRIIQHKRSPHVDHPELHWRDLVGSLHGKLRINANGVLLQMYVRHGDYKSEMELCDIFEQELEQMDEQLACMNLKQEIAQCC